MGTSNFRLILCCSSLLAGLAGCDGTDGNDLSNQAPAFTSATTVSVPENTSSAFYTATATDPDGDTLTYQITGGADRGVFQIASSGALSFKTTPNYERPADADRNNIYLVTLSVSDGERTSSLDLSVTVTNANDGIRVRRVATGFTNVVAIRAAPRANDMTGATAGLPPRLFIAQNNGAVSILTPSSGATKPFLDLRTTPIPQEPVGHQFASLAGGGLLDFATTSDFVTANPAPFPQPLWAVSYTSQDGGVLVRKGTSSSLSQMDTPDFDAVETTARFYVSYPAGASNYGGKLAWRYQNLRIAFGDGGVPASAEPIETEHGVIIQLNAARWFIFSRGLRNPSGLFVHPLGGMIITDRSATVEEVNYARYDASGVSVDTVHFGWPLFDGTQRIKDGSSPYPIVPPVLQYGHGTGNDLGTHVIGGVIYTGPVASLLNHYIFADQDSGNMWSVSLGDIVYNQTTPNTAMQRLNPDMIPDVGAIEHPTAIGLDQDNNLYIADADGEIFVIESAS